MIRDITIGQYYPSDSVLHRLDPRVKLFGTCVFLLSIFCYRGWAGFLVVTVFLVTMIRLSKVPFRFMVRGLRAIIVLLCMTALFNLFLTDGRTVLWEWKFLHFTWEGIILALKMLMRLTYLILGTSLMTLTTTPNQLTDGLEKSLAPFRAIHVPIHEISMMMSIALRYIPILIEETDKIMRAQMARGADFENKNLIKRAKAMVPIFVPLFVSAFRRARDLGLAMEARCYRGGEGRTKMKPLQYERRDQIAYVVLMLYFIVLIVLRFVPFASRGLLI